MAKQYIWVIMGVIAWLGSGSAIAEEPQAALDDLLKEYRSLELPLPPKDAKLVRYLTKGLAFLVKAGTEKEGAEIFQGFRQRLVDSDDIGAELPNPTEKDLKDVVFYDDDRLVFAIQFHARGLDGPAQFLLAERGKAAKVPARESLVELAWLYWEDLIGQPDSDRNLISKRLKELMKRSPTLDNERNQNFIKWLDLTLAPSKAKPGSIEAMIDDLVNFGGRYFYEEKGQKRRPADLERYMRILRLGFEAVPVLIEHLEDYRLTRSIVDGPFFMNFIGPARHELIAHMASYLLEAIAGESLGRDSFDAFLGELVTKTAAEEWWAKAKKASEEKYYLDHVFKKKNNESEKLELNPVMLDMIAAKYPKNVPALFRDALDKHPEWQSQPFVEALLECKLPEKEKLDSLQFAFKQQSIKHRLAALNGIEKLDKKEFKQRLLATLQFIPQRLPDSKWERGEIDEILCMAARSDEANIWSKLEEVIRKADPDLRLAMLEKMDDAHEKSSKSRRLHLLSNFLEDGQSGRSSLGYKIEVRNIAALVIGSLLQIKIEENEWRTAEEWAALRNKIRESLKKELESPK